MVARRQTGLEEDPWTIRLSHNLPILRLDGLLIYLYKTRSL
jgi:hypothetical protein